MHRDIHFRLCGFLLLVVVGVIGYVLTDYYEEKTPLRAFLAKSEDYLGLDGELSILPLECSTCALVGTSGHLLKFKYGSEIDGNHTCIFRLGFSPVRGTEKSVGARTTVRIVDSFSFFPFLKRPWKLMSSSFRSETWILFGRRPGDITWFHRPILSSVVKKDGTIFLWMTKSAEGEVYSTLKKHVNDSEGNKKISALWFALKVAKDSGCTSLNVYGIPDHQICKRHMDVAEPSSYWENGSHPVCVKGIDASFTYKNSASFVVDIPTVLERRAMVNWISHHIGRVTFYAPSWPVY